MQDDIFDDINLEKIIGRQFSAQLQIDEVIARGITCGVTSQCTLFKTPQTTHYLYIHAAGGLTLAEAQKIVRNMGLEADEFMPPHGDKEYFQRIGIEKFKQMFPGKYVMSREDTRYYETLASYNPALVRISKVNGAISGYDIASKQWRKIKSYAYTKMKVV